MNGPTFFSTEELEHQLDDIKSTLKSVNYSPRFFNSKQPCVEALKTIEDVQRCINTFKPTRGLTS